MKIFGFNIGKIKAAEKQESSPYIINQIKVQSIDRSVKSVNGWMQALRSAESPYNPNRKRLYDFYHRVLLDAHLYSLYSKRIRNVKNLKVQYVEPDQDTEEINQIFFYTPWMIHLIQRMMESIFWGHSLIELITNKEGLIEKVKLIPRHHVHPERGTVSVHGSYQSGGIPYREEPYTRYNLEVGESEELGLLNIAAVNTLLKQGGAIDFANFVELFGSPTRIFEYDPGNPNAKTEAEAVAAEAGNSASIILPEGQTSLRFEHGVTSGSDKVHAVFLEQLREELSTLILGQTMTTSDGSSRSQAEVHLSEQGQVTQEDKIFILNQLNHNLKPKLIELGYPIKNEGYFTFKEVDNISPSERAAIFETLSRAGVPLNLDHIYEVFKIPKPKESATNTSKTALKKKSTRRRTKSNLDEKRFFKAYLNTLQTEVKELLEGRESDEIYLKFSENAYEFALAKSKRLSNDLKDKTEEERQKIIEQHATWLETERNRFSSAILQAEEWETFKEEESLYPYLEWSAVLDENTRDSHRELDGVIRKLSDWSIFPGLEHGCRCNFLQRKSDENSKKPPKKLPKASPGLESKPLDFQAFSRKHPYFEEAGTGFDEQLEQAIQEDIEAQLLPLAGSKVKNKELKSVIVITEEGLKQALNLKAENQNIKNIALLDIKNLLKVSEYTDKQEEVNETINLLKISSLPYFLMVKEKKGKPWDFIGIKEVS